MRTCQKVPFLLSVEERDNVSQRNKELKTEKGKRLMRRGEYSMFHSPCTFWNSMRHVVCDFDHYSWKSKECENVWIPKKWWIAESKRSRNKEEGRVVVMKKRGIYSIVSISIVEQHATMRNTTMHAKKPWMYESKRTYKGAEIGKSTTDEEGGYSDVFSQSYLVVYSMFIEHSGYYFE